MSRFPSRMRQNRFFRQGRDAGLQQCRCCRLWYEYLTNGRCSGCQNVQDKPNQEQPK